MIDLAVLVLSCAPLVAQDTARALIQVESGGNPFAIGVVGGALVTGGGFPRQWPLPPHWRRRDGTTA